MTVNKSPDQKTEIKPFLIDEELKTKGLRKTNGGTGRCVYQ